MIDLTRDFALFHADGCGEVGAAHGFVKGVDVVCAGDNAKAQATTDRHGGKACNATQAVDVAMGQGDFSSDAGGFPVGFDMSVGTE